MADDCSFPDLPLRKPQVPQASLQPGKGLGSWAGGSAAERAACLSPWPWVLTAQGWDCSACCSCESRAQLLLPFISLARPHIPVLPTLVWETCMRPPVEALLLVLYTSLTSPYKQLLPLSSVRCVVITVWGSLPSLPILVLVSNLILFLVRLRLNYTTGVSICRASC